MTKYLLQHLLEDSVSAYPDAVAIRFNDQSITYRALDEQSNRLAHRLIEAGFEPRNTAGVLLHKSIEAVVAFFAVLKAGGAYISLDLNYSPPERIAKIIGLSRTGFLIADSENLQKYDESVAANNASDDLKVICVDQPADSPPSPPPGDPGTTDDDLAYILYTSGSTGSPKGVMLTHLNALTFVNWSLRCFAPTPDDQFSNHAPFQFDLSVFDIYVSIACGGCLNIVPPKIGANPRALVQWMAEKEITYWYSVPSVWISIINHARIDRDALGRLTHILFAGEVFPPKYLRQLMETLPDAAYYNLYGPTETNVCTYYQVKNIEDIGDRPVPIGRACENTEVVALDEGGTPVAVGEEGELMVKGSTVTKGYYLDPEKTRNAFVKSPVPEHNGALLYKTGDVVRRSDAHNYEYIGRNDLMVKCSGYRIELPEIEHALCEYDGITEAAVVSRVNAANGTASLQAYVTVANDVKFSILAIKKYLGGVLPKYMIPEVIEQIESIPKNANGKIDRQAIAGWAAP